MKSLVRLYLYKQLGFLRNLTRKKSTLVTTILLVSFYGFIIITSLTNQGESAEAAQNLYNLNMDLSKLIMLELGFLSIILISMILRKNTSLFLEEDAYYLFSGPFSEKQIMTYLTFSNTIQAFFVSLIGLFIFYSYSFDVYVSSTLGFLVFIVNFMVSLFFIILADTLYLYRISDSKHQKLSKIIIGILAGLTILVFGYFVVIDNFEITTAFSDFVVSKVFYFVPVIGFAKMILSSYILEETGFLILGLVLLISSIIIIYMVLIGFRGDYKEQILIDSKVVTNMIKENKKAGYNKSTREVKNGDVKVTNYKKAYSIFSKNWLLMKKTKSYVEPRILIIMVMYLAITFFTNLGYNFYMGMNVMVLFVVVNTSEILSELKNYQLYLIPDTSFNKIKAVILLPTLQAIVYNFISLSIAAVLLQAPITTYIASLLFSLGIIFIFVAGSVMSVNLLRESTNIALESIIRMIMMFLGLIPSGVAAFFILILISDVQLALILSGLVTLIINFVLAFLVLYLSRSMMQVYE